jgi:phytoene desaturase
MTNANKPSALIIGSGAAGLATAIYLARNGFDVKVLEKNNNPGGRLDQIEREGYTFDSGPTLYVMPHLYADEMERMGIEPYSDLNLQRVDPTYHIYYEDGQQLLLSSDLKVLAEQVEKFEPGASLRMLDYLAEGGQHYHLAMKHLVQRDFRRLTDFFNLRNLPLMFQVRALRKHYSYTSRFFDDPHLKAAFTFQDMYMGLSPFMAPTTFSLMQYSELAHGVWYPRGGMYSITLTLVEHAQEAGAEVLLNHHVARIDVEGQRAVGVTMEDGEQMTADFVIANADLPYVYDELLPPDGTMKRLERKHYSCSTISFFWALDRTFTELEPHMLFLADDYEGGFQALNGGDLPQRPSLYVHTPTRLDASCAPAGCDTAIGIVPVGNMDSHPDEDWQTVRRHARQAIFERLETIGLDTFSDHIEFETCYTPESWHKRYNLYRGSTHGLSHRLLQLAYMRPHNQHKRYRNLFFVGASTHPGTGVPTVLVSARLAAERILDGLGMRE